MNFLSHDPVKIVFGAGKLKELHEQKLPGKKALIVISNGKSTRANGYLDTLEHELKLAGVESVVFDKILPNPVKRHVMEGAEFARKNNCDFVIGLGGGSSIDSAKAIAVMTPNQGDYWDYVAGGTGKARPVPVHPLPIVAITTTAGTGTEADPWTVTTNEDTNEKIGFGYEETFPTLSIVDPELMLTVPPALTAYQGFDALFHSTEGHFAKCATPISELYSLKAIKLIGENLPEAVKNGKNLTARENVALANTLAGFVETFSSCTSEHSLEHALSAYHPNLPHGAGLIAISKAYYTHFASVHAADEKMIEMAKALGKTDVSKPEDFVTALVELQKACGVDNIKLSDWGVKKEEIDKYVKNAYSAMGGLFEVDPAPLTEDDCRKILAASYR
ncbi:MAG: iron-containing alcohol dehydrogenase [Treponema sp.]|jgi:alcohol dehydrogenase|nr:iron-containing alcohol dehydrogenase [Treponema sp.]